MTRPNTSLFAEFLEVCNTALAENKEKFPYKQILALSRQLFGGKPIEMLVYEKDATTPAVSFTVRFEDDRFVLVTEGGGKPSFSFKLKRSYLKQVVENREQYIEHPERLDWDWLRSRLDIGTEKESNTVREVMTLGVECVSPRSTVRDAAERMRDHDIGVLPVWESGQLVGIVTDRDIATRGVAAGRDSNQTLVQDIMTPSVTCCGPDLPVREAARIMESQQIRRLVVIDEARRPVAIVSLGDVAVRGKNPSLSAELVSAVSSPAA